MAAKDPPLGASATDLQVVLSCVPTAALKSAGVESSQRITVRVSGTNDMFGCKIHMHSSCLQAALSFKFSGLQFFDIFLKGQSATCPAGVEVSSAPASLNVLQYTFGVMQHGTFSFRVSVEDVQLHGSKPAIIFKVVSAYFQNPRVLDHAAFACRCALPRNAQQSQISLISVLLRVIRWMLPCASSTVDCP